MYIPQDPLLVLHMTTSWQLAAQRWYCSELIFLIQVFLIAIVKYLGHVKHYGWHRVTRSQGLIVHLIYLSISFSIICYRERIECRSPLYSLIGLVRSHDFWEGIL